MGEALSSARSGRPGFRPDNLAPFAPAQLNGAGLHAGAQVWSSATFPGQRRRVNDDTDPQLSLIHI